VRSCDNGSETGLREDDRLDRLMCSEKIIPDLEFNRSKLRNQKLSILFGQGGNELIVDWTEMLHGNVILT
jgi:hypothetical protein